MHFVIIFGAIMYWCLLFAIITRDLRRDIAELHQIHARIDLMHFCIFNNLPIENYDSNHFEGWSEKQMLDLLKKLKEK